MSEGSASRKRRARTLLSVEQLLALDAALIAAYRDHDALCERHPVARGHVSRPAIPSAFSESLTALLIGELYGVDATVAFGGVASDLLVISPDGALTVEVKASGVSRFQELKERDLAADALVWVDFGSRYVHGQGSVTFHHLPQPRRFAAPRRKLTLDLFLRSVEQLEGFRSITVLDISELLTGAGGAEIVTSAPQLRLVPMTRLANASPDASSDLLQVRSVGILPAGE
ncbi:MAG TPA: hypothetical protein VN618_08895 [Solirubrobacteraceae bacterium]|nr:hypothetical protein [Solirubrobacteraceae bacterium]